jgi:ribonuclease P protein subunit POP4
MRKHTIEYIGLRVTVVKSPSRERIGISGVVVDETKNTFLIEKDNGKSVTIPKESSRFRFEKGGEGFEVEGSDIAYRPEERPKKAREQ